MGNAIIGTPQQQPDEKPVDSGAEPAPRETLVKGLWATLEQWQVAIDERVRAIMPSGPSLSDLQQALAKMDDRLSVLEKKAAEHQPPDDSK